MKGWISENKRIVFGVVLGAITGYGYYHFIGCTNGQCLISSKPLNSTLYFGLMGGFLVSIFKKGAGGKAN